jgi:hypothetical protein
VLRRETSDLIKNNAAAVLRCSSISSLLFRHGRSRSSSWSCQCHSFPCSVEAELINTNVRIVCEFPQFAESSEANVAGEHCAQLAMMRPLPWGQGALC